MSYSEVKTVEDGQIKLKNNDRKYIAITRLERLIRERNRLRRMNEELIEILRRENIPDIQED